jgi:excisionase family DNA binding protein
MLKSPPSSPTDDYSTLEVAKLFGLAVRSVQLMVDRGELDAWKTPGGHRRIARASVEAWLTRRDAGALHGDPSADAGATHPDAPRRLRVLLIEDSVHYQNLVSMLFSQNFPELDLHVASDGIVGLAMYGQLQPEFLLVDILLPGIDGAALISSLRSHPQFAGSDLVVITSLDEAQRAPYAFALQGVTVLHKPRLVMELPALIRERLDARTQ